MTAKATLRQQLEVRLEAARFRLRSHTEAEILARKGKGHALQECLEIRRQLLELDKQ